jgi:regulator of sigma D
VQQLQEQEKYDNSIRDLALGMTSMLSFVDTVQDRAKIQQLKKIVEQMMKLIEDASNFIIEYLSDGRFSTYQRLQRKSVQLML